MRSQLHTNPDAVVVFSNNLTCVIGGRGTCKSTLVESIRFAFNCDEARIRDLTKADGIITKTLGPGSVRCEIDVLDITSNHADHFVLERETGGDARAYYFDTKTSAIDRLTGAIEIYSQNALQAIASNTGSRLRLQLIDRPNRERIQALQREADEQISQLKTLGDRARLLRSEIAKRQQQLRELPSIRLELGRTVEDRPTLEPSIEEKHASYLRRRRTVELLETLRSGLGRLHDFLRPEITNAYQAFLNTQQDLLAVGAESETVTDIIVKIDAAFNAIIRDTSDFNKLPLADVIAAVTDAFLAKDEEYLELRQHQQQITDSLKREDLLRRRLSELEIVERESSRFRGLRPDLCVTAIA